MLEVNIGTPREVRGLLEEDGIWAEDLTHIYCNFLGESWRYEQ